MENLKIIVGLFLLIVILGVPIIQRRKLTNTTGSNPVSEAEVYLAYGRKKEAKAILEKYLVAHPGDQKALSLLEKAKA